MKKTLLMIEDDQALLEATATFLRAENFQVLAATDGEQGLALALEAKPDLVMIDVVLPKMGGFDVCRQLRGQGFQAPIIMLTGRKKEEVDRVIGLEIGADDYILKPFGQRELLARIQAILRRTERPLPALEEYAFDDVRLDFRGKTATKAGREFVLTAKEFGLLRLLINHEGEVVSRDMILNEVWGYDKYPTTRTVDTFIHNLRRKIEKDPTHPVHLLTIPWMGYKFQK